jgi:hypothetical protein
MPASRVFVAGSVRFWFNAWFDLAQVSGGSDQGTLNPMSTWAFYQVTASDSRDSTIAWLQATGADAVVVNYPESREYYHDFGTVTKKFEGLPVLFDNGRGDRIVQVPRRYPGLARIVQRVRHRQLGPPRIDYDYDSMSKYVSSIEDGSPRAAQWERLGPESVRVKAALEPGEAVVIQETWDVGWKARTANRADLPVAKDALHFMLLDPGPGMHEITLTYTLPAENQIGRAVTVCSVVLIGYLLVWRGGRQRKE